MILFTHYHYAWYIVILDLESIRFLPILFVNLLLRKRVKNNSEKKPAYLGALNRHSAYSLRGCHLGGYESHHDND